MATATSSCRWLATGNPYTRYPSVLSSIIRLPIPPLSSALVSLAAIEKSKQEETKRAEKPRWSSLLPLRPPVATEIATYLDSAMRYPAGRPESGLLREGSSAEICSLVLCQHLIL